MRRALLVLSCACGRIGFDPLGSSGDGGPGVRGVIDPTFGNAGIVTYDYKRADGTFQNDHATGVAIDSAGRIVVSGEGSYDYVVTGDQAQMAAITLRLLPDGSLDSTWQNGSTSTPGITADTSGFWSRGTGVIVDSGDAVLLCGYREWSGTDDPTAYRYLAVGAQSDPGFGAAGIAHISTPGEDDAETCVRDPVDGDYVLAGGDNTAQSTFVAKLLPGGAVDASFGIATFDGPSFDRVYGLAIDGAGLVYAIGVTNSADLTVWRYLPNGTLDGSYAGGGGTYRGGGTIGYHGALDASGRLIVPGIANNDAVVIALDAGGTLDPAFQTFTYDSATGTSMDEARAVAIDAAGWIYVAGTVATASGSAMAVWKVSPAGALDPTFGTGGMLVATGPTATASAIALDAQGRLVVAGSVLDATWDIAVWRIE